MNYIYAHLAIAVLYFLIAALIFVLLARFPRLRDELEPIDCAVFSILWLLFLPLITPIVIYIWLRKPLAKAVKSMWKD